jgi:hypothetical protein
MCFAGRARIVCFLVTTSLIAVSAASQEVGYQDLTDVEPNPLKYKKFVPDRACNGGSGGGLGMGIGCPPNAYPFELSLLSVDTSELSIGGEAIILLRLRNMGRDAASVPWITDPDQIELPDDNGTFNFSEADLRANIAQDGGTTYFSIPIHLYGAKEVPGSLQEIRPGEYVELKLSLVLDCKTAVLDCRSLRVGSGRLSITWTELDSRVTYEKCGTQRGDSRTRELTSDFAVMSIVGRVDPQ